MSRYCIDRKPEPIVRAASEWRDKCLLANGSVLSSELVWTNESLNEFDRYFSRNLDEGEGDFFEKLETQLRPAASKTKKLAAEMLWLLFLCPSNIKPQTKVEGIARVWSWSGEELATDHAMLSDEVLSGIGSGGTGFNTNRWRELLLAIELVRRFKNLDSQQQRDLLADGWRLAEWLGTIPGSDSRQFPYMLQFLLYPDDFERIFGGTDRRRIVTAFERLPVAEVSRMNAIDIDRLLKKIRDEQEAEHETKDIDFYESPLLDVWKPRGNSAYLLTWNPNRFVWPSFDADRAATVSGKTIVMRWACASGDAKVGDRVYLLRTGKDPRGVIARGNIVRGSYPAAHRDADKANAGATQLSVDVEFTSIRDPNRDEYVAALDLSKIKAGDQEWSPQSSGILIKPRAATRLEKLWSRLAQPNDGVETVLPPYRRTSEIAGPKNLVLFGPPGTGKTYRMKQLFADYTAAPEERTEGEWLQDLIEGMTWWETISIALQDLGGRSAVQGIFEHRIIQAKARVQTSKNVRATIWGSLQQHTRVDSTTVAYASRTSPLIFDKSDDSKWFFVPGWEVECPQVTEAVDRLRRGPRDNKATVSRYTFVTFHQSYGYEDFVEGIRPQEAEDGEHGIVYRVVPGAFRQICTRAKDDPTNRYAIFIDEINRGNIAKILGELITLVEADKRAVYGPEGNLVAGMEATLPYSGDLFGVPKNLDIIATMNTADRSIALIDTALRRRFRFEELMPLPGVISGADGNGEIPDGEGGVIDLRALLEAINRRIRFLLHRDQTLGHAYFTEVKTFDALRAVLTEQVLPLLQEYFYEDWHRIQLVFCDVGANGERLTPQIVCHREVSEEAVLGFDHDELENSVEYWVAPVNDITPDCIRKIYETT